MVEPIETPHGILRARAETEADRAFLLVLHDSVKGAELALMPVPEPMRRQLVDMQFRAMSAGYRSMFPAARYAVITLNDAPIGRLITDDSRDMFHIVHIALLPERRHRGIGGALMGSILDEPRRNGVRCEATVAPDNLASLRLWSRLGFQECGRAGTDLILEWRPQPQATTDVGRLPPPAR